MPRKYYNNKTDYDRRFLADTPTAFLLGVVRLRQLRIKKGMDMWFDLLFLLKKKITMGVKSGFSSLPTAVFIAQIFHYICQWGQANKLKQTKEGENPRELAGGKLVSYLQA